MASREQVLKKRIEDIKDADSKARNPNGGKFLSPKFKKRVEDLYTRYDILKKKAPGMNQSVFDKQAKALMADTNKVFSDATNAFDKLTDERKRKGAQERANREAKARAEGGVGPEEAADAQSKQAPGGVDRGAAENARAAVKDARPGADNPPATSAKPKRVGKWNGKFSHNGKKIALSGGQAGEFFNKLSAKEKKQVLDLLGNPEETPKGARLRNAMGAIPEIKAAAIEYRKSLVKGAATTAATTAAPKADAPAPPATTTTATTTDRPSIPKWNGKAGKTGPTLSQQQAKDFFETLKPAEKKKVLKKLGNPSKTTGSQLRNAIGQIPDLKAAAISYRASLSTTPSQRAAAESRAAKAKPPATTTASQAATVVDERPPTQARQAAAKKAAKKAARPSPQPSPNQINEKPVTQTKTKAKAKPKAKPLTEKQKANRAAKDARREQWHAEEPERAAAHAKKKARAQASRQRIADQASVYTEGGVADPADVRTLKGQRAVDRQAAIDAESKAAKGKKGKAKWKDPEYKPKDPVAGEALTKSKTPHKGKLKAAVASALGVDNVDELLGKDWNYEELADYLDDASKPGGKGFEKTTKANRLVGKGQRILRTAGAGAKAISPGAAAVAGSIARVGGRFLGPAGVVYELGTLGYNISQKGLVEAMRDEESSVLTGVDRQKLDEGMKRAEARSRSRAIQTRSATTPGTKDTSRAAQERKAEIAKEDRQKARLKTGSAGRYNISKKNYEGLEKSAVTGHIPAEFRKKGKRYKGSRTKGEIDAAARQRAIARDKAKNLPFLKRVLKRRAEASKEKAASDYKRRVARESLRGTAPTKAERKEAARNMTEAALKRMRQRRGDFEQEKMERQTAAEYSEGMRTKANVMKSFKDAAEKARKEQAAKRIDAQTRKNIKDMGLELTENEAARERLKRFGF